MNATAALIYRAAETPDPKRAVADVRRHVTSLKTLDLDLLTAVQILDGGSRVARRAGLDVEADRLEEARDVLVDGGIVPTQMYFGWLPAEAPAATDARAAKASAPTQRIVVEGLDELVAEMRKAHDKPLVVASTPARVTHRKLIRDAKGRISESLDVSEDAP